MQAQDRFQTTSALLLKHEAIWKAVPFKSNDNRLTRSYPELHKWLNSLTDEEVSDYQCDNEALLEASAPFFSDAESILSLIKLPIRHSEKQDMPFCWDSGVPGRKAHQIKAFIESLQAVKLPIVEWCCGKQHLSRVLVHLQQRPALGLEIDAQLVLQAQQLSEKKGLSALVKTVECNVLDPQTSRYFNQTQQHIALHACGGLHRHMIQSCASEQVNTISLSPCCYHKFSESNIYQPLSKRAKQFGLAIDMDQLRLAVREPMTASKSENQKRRQLNAWRLGFDLLQRELRQKNHYLDLPSLNSQHLKAGFEQFCLDMASLKGLQLRQTSSLQAYEAQGYVRLRDVEREELMQMLFKRLLELWLNLDLSLYLEEQGYHVELSTFCSPEITPRNILLEATFKH